MKNTSRYLILLGLIIAAVVSYSIGFTRGTAFFVILGILFELAFWMGLFRSNPNKTE